MAYDISRKEKVTRNLPFILLNIGGAYSKKGDQVKAMSFFHQAEDAANEHLSVVFQSLIAYGMAEHYQRLHQRDSALYYAKRSIALVQQDEFKYLSLKPSKLLTEIYENTDADSAFKYLKIYKIANDSVFSARSNQELQVLTFQEDQRQQELADAKTKFRNSLKTNILLGGITMLCLIAFILFRNNKQKQKANVVLKSQKTEIEKTLAQLESTQKQLIHAEKMVSLGELTAGIAHEIQNPLNFVNNFSEVNTELIDELNNELAIGNMQLAKEIAGNIKDNEQKIIFHGKRADAIVKGMLQHSRSSSSVKELTDINALADEYLRLAYHGLRAKDKSFNATMKTDYDESIGLINIVPQDIGRVILNLITNAFYVVSERKKNATLPPGPLKGEEAFEPLVSVTTKLILPHLGGKGEKESLQKGQQLNSASPTMEAAFPKIF
ncbi:MAG: hypothetical protein ABJB16_11865 [Saprospiraceae bacterium]